MKILTVVGARPQFIKAAVVSRALRIKHREILVHTGQHYDSTMSKCFFDELSLPHPDYNLNVGPETSDTVIKTLKARRGLVKIIKKEKPGWILVYGDTYSTLAGAFAASDSRTRLAHVEAGLRSFDLDMPEEFNRVVADGLSDALFCPTQKAVDNLLKEGRRDNIYLVGDVMYDACLFYLNQAEKLSGIMNRLALNPKEYLLATVHRKNNTDDPDRLKNILKAFERINEKIVFPLHPRTRLRMKKFGLLNRAFKMKNLHLTGPAGYFDMLVLEKNARVILTDSGGVQKEAFFFKVPCITLREETEWTETVDAGWNKLAGADIKLITGFTKNPGIPAADKRFYGSGNTAEKIIKKLERNA